MQVPWRTVFWGLGLQFAIGLFVIRTQPGLVAFKWLGDQVQVLYLMHQTSVMALAGSLSPYVANVLCSTSVVRDCTEQRHLKIWNNDR